MRSVAKSRRTRHSLSNDSPMGTTPKRKGKFLSMMFETELDTKLNATGSARSATMTMLNRLSFRLGNWPG